MNKKTLTIIVVIISIVLVGLLMGGNLVSGLFTSNNEVQSTTTMENNEQNTQTAPQLQKQDLVVGTGDMAIAGKKITVNYTGMFKDGKVFDSSLDAGRVPFTFTLGAGQVIKGWDIGVEGMKVGGKRLLVIPSDLAYGPKDYGPIPGNSTLVFQVELLKVE